MKKQIKDILLFISILLISYILIHVFNIRYSSVSDYLINNILSGSFGDKLNYEMIHHYNNIISIFLGTFYKLIPFINFYTLYLVSLMSLCFTLIIKRIIKNKKYLLLCPILIIYLITLFNLTYTIIAYLCITLGLIELILKKDLKNFILADFLILNGFLLRYVTIYPILFSLTILILIKIIKEKDKKFVINIIILSLILITSNLIDMGLYSANDITKNFKNYQQASIEIRDYKKISYDKYKEIFEHINWTKNDLTFFYTWNFADNEKYSKENLKYIADNIRITDRYNFNIISIFENFYKQITSIKTDINQIYFILTIILFIITLIYCKNKKELCYVFLSCIAINLLLIFRCRNPFRVVYPQYLIAIIYFIYSLIYLAKENPLNKKLKYFYSSISLICTLVFSIYFGLNYYKENDYYKTIVLTNKNTLNKLSEKENTLFLVDSTTYNSLTMNYKMTERKNVGEYKNILKCGGGDFLSKRYYNCLKNYNLKESNNLYKNLLNENVYFIGKVDNKLKNYLKENINPNMKLTKNIEINNYKIYKYTK